MIAKLNDLRQKRGAAVFKMREMLERCTKESRTRTVDEEAQFDGWCGEVDALGAEIEKIEKEASARKRVEDLDAEMRRFAPAPVAGPGQPPGRENAAAEAGAARAAAFSKWVKLGTAALEEREFRALQADLSTSGGYLIPPEMFLAEMIKFVDNATPLRQLARKIDLVGAASLGCPELTTDMAAPAWTAEIGALSEDSSLAVGKRELTPNQLTKMIRVSMKLLQGAPNVEAIVNERLAYQFAITEEAAFETGTGAAQPLGVFTASANGVTTARDVSTGNSTTAFVADNLIDNLYSLKPQHQARATWLMHRDAVKMARKLKDGQGQYLWAPGLAAGVPDTLLNRPVVQSEYAPNTFTTGLYVGIVGNFDYYWIVDAPSAFSMQRLVELYAGNSQIGFVGRKWLDGAPVLAEAFSRVKLG